MRGFARPPAPIWLSVCMIVKNEEQRLLQCLDSVRSLADEIIIVDTGSSDRTISIAKNSIANRNKVQIFHFEWCDDFSMARNYAIAQAKGRWILIIDADEVLEQKAIAILQAVMQRSDCLAVNLLRVEVGAKQAPYSLVLRLFRNHPAIAFTGIYHESIDCSVTALQAAEPDWQVLNIEIPTLRHYGYTDSEINLKHKYEFAKRLMHKHLEAFPEDVYMLNKLGALYICNQNIGNQNICNQNICNQNIGNQDNISFGIELLEKGLALIDTTINRTEPQNLMRCELHYHLGIAYSQNGNLELAKNAYQQAIALDVPELIKLSAYFNLGNIYQASNQQASNQQKAIAYFEIVTKIAPEFAQGYFNLGLALKTSGRFNEAIAAYRNALYLEPDYAEAHQNLGVVLIKVGYFQEAIASFKLAIQLHEQQNNWEIAKNLQSILQEIQK